MPGVIGEPCFDIFRYPDAVAARLLEDVDKRGVPSVCCDPDPLGNRAVGDGGYVLQPHQSIGSARENGVADLVDRRESNVRHGQVQLVVVFQAADGGNDVFRVQRPGHVGKSQPVRLEPGRVDIDAILLPGTALYLHARHAVHGG